MYAGMKLKCIRNGIEVCAMQGVERTHPMESSPRDLARRSRLAFIFVQFFLLWEATLYSPYAVCQSR